MPLQAESLLALCTARLTRGKATTLFSSETSDDLRFLECVTGPSESKRVVMVLLTLKERSPIPQRSTTHPPMPLTLDGILKPGTPSWLSTLLTSSFGLAS